MRDDKKPYGEKFWDVVSYGSLICLPSGLAGMAVSAIWEQPTAYRIFSSVAVVSAMCLAVSFFAYILFYKEGYDKRKAEKAEAERNK